MGGKDYLDTEIDNGNEITRVQWFIESDLSKEDSHLSNYPRFAPVTEWKRKVFRQAWIPADNNPDGFVILLHGLHEHSSRYDAFARDIVTKSNLTVVALDWYAHGKSSGTPGSVPSFNYFIHDGIALAKDVQNGNFPDSGFSEQTDKPIYLWGHSMGGCISLNLLIEAPELFNACALSAPLCDITYGIPCVCLAAPLVSCIAAAAPYSENKLAKRIEPKMLCHNEDNVKEFLKDPLVNFGVVQNRLTQEMFAATVRIQNYCGDIETPLLIMHSSEDPVVPQPPSEALINRVSSKDTKYKKYEHFFHEMINESEEQRLELVVQSCNWYLGHK